MSHRRAYNKDSKQLKGCLQLCIVLSNKWLWENLLTGKKAKGVDDRNCVKLCNSVKVSLFKIRVLQGGKHTCLHI